MSRKPSNVLTDAELRLMRILWSIGSGTVHDVKAELPEDDSLAYNSVLTTLRVLEQKGYVGHEKQGKSHRYRAVVDRFTVRKRTLHYLLDRFFNESPQELVANLIETGDLTESELTQLREKIRRKKDQ